MLLLIACDFSQVEVLERTLFKVNTAAEQRADPVRTALMKEHARLVEAAQTLEDDAKRMMVCRSA